MRGWMIQLEANKKSYSFKRLEMLRVEINQREKM